MSRSAVATISRSEQFAGAAGDISPSHVRIVTRDGIATEASTLPAGSSHKTGYDMLATIAADRLGPDPDLGPECLIIRSIN